MIVDFTSRYSMTYSDHNMMHRVPLCTNSSTILVLATRKTYPQSGTVLLPVPGTVATAAGKQLFLWISFVCVNEYIFYAVNCG